MEMRVVDAERARSGLEMMSCPEGTRCSRNRTSGELCAVFTYLLCWF